jgi:hypothetical protein
MMVHIRREEMEIRALQHILSPFTPKLWLAVTLTIIVFTVLLELTSFIHLKYSYGTARVLNGFRFQNSWHYVLAAFCLQGKWQLHYVCTHCTKQTVKIYTCNQPIDFTGLIKTFAT